MVEHTPYTLIIYKFFFIIIIIINFNKEIYYF